MIKNKSRLLNKALAIFSTFYSRKKNIVLFAPFDFHSKHFIPIIQHLKNNTDFNLILVGEFSSNYNCSYYRTLEELPIYKKYHVFISTEIRSPWRIDTIKVFYGHGIGPKLDYQTNEEINCFDYIFTPCDAIHKAQKALNIPLKKVGLAILDDFHGAERSEIDRFFELDPDLPLIIYAPSWNNNALKISDIDKISSILSYLDGFNTVISPHPNLLKSDRCDGFSYLTDTSLKLNKKISTLDLCAAADIVISDISSILFEAMALEKYVFLDGNEYVYKSSGAENILDELKEYIPTLDWHVNASLQINQYLQSGDTSKMRKYINNYLFNNGRATIAFENALYEVIDQ